MRFKNNGYLLILLILITGCNRSALFVVNSLARFDDYTEIKNISYGASELNRLDIFHPKEISENIEIKKPVIVFFYGGCWGGCYTGFKEDYLFVAQTLTSQNYIVVLADYRRYPEVRFAKIMEDAAGVVEWVKENIEKYGGDSGNIFLMGHSAGAHLAAMLTLNEAYLQENTRHSVSGFIGMAGPYDFLPFTEPYQKEVFAPETAYPQSQPINFVDGSEPPLLLLQGNDDETVKRRNIKNLAEKVRRLGGSVKTHYYDGLDHVGLIASLSIPIRNTKPVLKDIVGFLSRNKVQDKQ